jgi:hypothetical protein
MNIEQSGLSGFLTNINADSGIELGDFRFSFFYRLQDFFCMFPGIFNEQTMSIHSAANHTGNKNISRIGFVSGLTVHRLHHRII